MAEIPFAGTFTIGDTLKSLIVNLVHRRTRAAYDLTGATAKLVAVGRNNPALTIDASMSVSAPATSGIVTIANFLAGIGLTTRQETFEAEVEISIGADKTYSDPFSFAVRKRRV